MSKLQGTSCLTTIVLSLRDEIHLTAEAFSSSQVSATT
jgi:hypothetical protein